MNVERERLALQHLETALEWPAAEREARIDALLHDDPELRTEVRELLAAANAVDESLPTRLPVAPLADDRPPPERIGPYRVGALLGSGGMGRVYRAERADGVFEQTVAIKLMRRSLIAGVVAEQFARERQILARLQHRNIAQLYDGGVTDEGLSYFVMELVEGRSVTEYAAGSALDLRATLQLFRQICGAVRHAHAHLVVHADLKPSNVIVDAGGTAKLVDFGVARALAGAGAAEEAAPRTLGLTFDYASPARRRGQPPTTADDVYSLGVLLDELLRRFAPLPADLRSVIARARAAEESARYASVDALQDDVQRWLTGLPVAAHGQRPGYLMRRFLGRHRLAAAIGGGALLLLAGAAVALAVLYVNAQHARERAEQRFADARALSHYVLFDIYDRLASVPRSLTLRRDVADAGQGYLNRLAADPLAPAAVKLDVIEGLRRLAQVQGMPGSANLAQVALARENLDRAQRVAATLPDEHGIGVRRDRLLARVEIERARLEAYGTLDFAAATAALDRAEALVRRGGAPGDTESRELELDLAVERASVLGWQGRYAESIAVSRPALALSAALRRDAGPAARSMTIRHARLLDIYAESLSYAGDPRGAVASYLEQVALLRSLQPAGGEDFALATRLSRAQWALGTNYLELADWRAAEAVLHESASLAAHLAELEPDDRNVARAADIAANAHAQALIGLRRYDEALPILARSRAHRGELARADAGNWSLARDHAIVTATYGDALADAGRGAEACRVYDEARAEFGRIRAAGKLPEMDETYAIPNLEKRYAHHCAARR